MEIDFSGVLRHEYMQQPHRRCGYSCKQGISYSQVPAASNEYGSPPVQKNSDYTYVKNESRNLQI